MRCSRFTFPAAAAAVLAVFYSTPAGAGIPTIQPTDGVFHLNATTGYISTPDGNSILVWGYDGGGGVQYPGPTLEVTQGDMVTVELTVGANPDYPTAPIPTWTSLVFPGQSDVMAAGAGSTQPGLLSDLEVTTGGTLTYTFTASQPGTYQYHSGTDPDLQVEMGLFGALIVRPTGFVANPDPEDPLQVASKRAYGHSDSVYDREYLFLHSEMDPRIHRQVELGQLADVDTTTFFPVYWFYNGRCAPDTFYPKFDGMLPAQPYNTIVHMHPGEKVLMRMIGGGRGLHPFHAHGNSEHQIAKDGRLRSSDGGASGANLSLFTFTMMVAAGQTIDAVFEWTGAELGFDIYGHQPDVDNPPTGNFPGAEDVDRNGDGVFNGHDPQPGEYLADHLKPLPVLLPDGLDLGFGGFWSGSPFLGSLGSLPPGEGGLNPFGAFTFLWHNHTEKTLVNNNIFPGGQLSILFVEHPTVDLTMPPFDTGDGKP